MIFSVKSVADYRFENLIVTGVSRISEAKVRETIEPHLQGSPNEGDYAIAAIALTKALRDAGAFIARVYVKQDEKGNFELQAIEGALADDGIVLYRSSNRISDKVITKQLEDILEPGSVITADKYERAILLTNDLPGVGGSVATILPAEKVGEANFEFSPAEGQLFRGNAYADNFGSKYTGMYRLGASLDINSPMRLGDKISLGGNVTDKGTTFFYIDGSLPVFLAGLRAGVTLDALDYKTNQPQNLRGDSQHFSGYLNYPLIRSRLSNLYGELRLGRDNMLDEDSRTKITDRVVNASSFKLYGDSADSFYGGGVTKFDIEVVTGKVDLSGYAPYKREDARTAKTDGSFARMAWSASRLQHIQGPWQSFVEVAGQLASKRMDASQSIAFGGAYNFPGYHAGELLGDEGWRVHGDIRYQVASPWFGGQQQWSVFYDYGRIRTHAKSIIAGVISPGIDQTTYTMQSAGVGFSQVWQRYQLQGTLAWRVNNELPNSLLDTASDNMLGWLHLVYNF